MVSSQCSYKGGRTLNTSYSQPHICHLTINQKTKATDCLRPENVCQNEPYQTTKDLTGNGTPPNIKPIYNPSNNKDRAVYGFYSILRNAHNGLISSCSKKIPTQIPAEKKSNTAYTYDHKSPHRKSSIQSKRNTNNIMSTSETQTPKQI